MSDVSNILIRSQSGTPVRFEGRWGEKNVEGHAGEHFQGCYFEQRVDPCTVEFRRRAASTLCGAAAVENLLSSRRISSAPPAAVFIFSVSDVLLVKKSVDYNLISASRCNCFLCILLIHITIKQPKSSVFNMKTCYVIGVLVHNAIMIYRS